MNLAIVEDLQKAYDNIKDYTPVLRSKDVKLVDSLSKRIKFPSIFDRLIKNLSDFSGDLILILDLGLDLPIATERSLRDRYDIAANIIDSQIDGVVVALEAIKNANISPLLILIATELGHQGSIECFLQDRINRSGRANQIRLEFSPRGFGLSHQKYARDIVNFSIDQFERYFDGRFERFFARIEKLNHDDCQSAKAQEMLSSLLNVDFESSLKGLGSKQQILQEALKSMGSETGKPLSAVGAWIYALAAYRHVHPEGNWQRKFNVDDLDESLSYCALLPHQKLETLRGSIRIFHEMCCRLFMSDDMSRSDEALENVSLSAEYGLSFVLNFSCQGVPGSIHERLKALYKSSVSGKKLSSSRHKTSFSLWQFWQASSLSDSDTLGEEGMFSPIWRLNVVPREGRKTQVVFYE
ncbi:MAG: hypothetical protein AAFN40_14875 [Cyanobacteria bacterium J06560_6]